jgi:hydroxyethylthiazole kinase
VVAVTGRRDAVSDGERHALIEGGTPLLTRITGTGCLLSAIIGAFAAANPGDHLEAAAAAMWLLKKAGERAEWGLRRKGALGEFKSALLDNLSLA